MLNTPKSRSLLFHRPLLHRRIGEQTMRPMQFAVADEFCNGHAGLPFTLEVKYLSTVIIRLANSLHWNL